MTGLSWRANTSALLELDLCCIESADLLWNICSCKRIKDGTTETSHVDQLKVRALACVRPRHRFGHDGHPKQPITAIHQQVPAGSHLSLDSTGSTGSMRPAGSVGKPSNVSPQGYDRLKRLMEDFQDLGS